VLKNVFEFTPNPQEELIFQKVITQLQPQIREFIQLVKTGAPMSQLQLAFFTLENYALDLKHRFSVPWYQQSVNHMKYRTDTYFSLWELTELYGYLPPQVMGSCGGSGGRLSTDIFGSDSIFHKPDFADLFNPSKETNFLTCKRCGEGKHFHCPGCDTKIPAGEGRTRCTRTTCAVTKENWSGAKCN
jgi:hypothetical protein